MMAEFVAQPVVCANPEKEETLGIVLNWIANNVQSESIRPIMKKHGMESFTDNKWYSTQAILNVIREIYKEADTMDLFVAIGKKFAMEYPFDPDVHTIRDAIYGFNQAYHRVHRGMHPDEGILVEQTAPNTCIVTNNTPWPGEIIYGMLWTFPSRFEPKRAFSIKFLEPDESLRSIIEVVEK